MTYIDELFGRFLDNCDEAGLLDNALVILCSDHGEMMGQHGLNQKFCPYEEALRVPCAMSWPGVIRPGLRCGMDVSLVDLAPTILAAAGVDPARIELDGENLLEYFAGERSEPDSRGLLCPSGARHPLRQRGTAFRTGAAWFGGLGSTRCTRTVRLSFTIRSRTRMSCSTSQALSRPG